MIYEFRVNDLAGEFNVHRNTIRNWINSGVLPAEKTAGRRYRIKWEDYNRLCKKFGHRPQQQASYEPDLEISRTKTAAPPPAPFPLQSTGHPLHSHLPLGDICVGCGSCASACPISGIDGMDPRKLIRMAILDMQDEILALDWPWKCTLCGRCEQACPVGVEIVQLIRKLRATQKEAWFPAPFNWGSPPAWSRGITSASPRKILCRC